jgi:exonuclease SbcC
MQILSIHLKNIKSHRDTELSFSAGINVLSGPNGAGKSTVFEAIGYAMFGVDAKDFVSNVERFLSIGSKKGEISVVFRADDGETYRVSRTVGAAAKWLLAREIGGAFEVVVILPGRIAELGTARNDLLLRQRELGEKDAALAALEVRLVELAAQEKALAALTGEVQLLENRITDGIAKTAEQGQRVEESRTALKIVDESKSGKEAFDKTEALLIGLRRQEQQRRVVEQEIAGLEKESLRLSQLLLHERTETEKNGKQLDAEQDTRNFARKDLQPDLQLTAAAARVPAVKIELDALKGRLSLLDGRRESLLEGKDKLAEGICPFFQEECRNIAATVPRDVFSSRIAELERLSSELDEKLRKLALQLKEAESAEKDCNSRVIRLQELNKQGADLEERRSKNQERAAALDTIVKQQADAAALVAARKGELKAFAGLDAAIANTDKERHQHQLARDAYTANLNVANELDARIQHLEKMQQLLEVLTGERTARQAELDKQNILFQPELLQRSRQEKELLLAGAATLRQQINDLGRNADRLENEIALLNNIQGEITAKRAEIKSFEEKEKLVKFLRNQIFNKVSAQLSERFREEISLRADRIYRTIAESDEELYWGDNYQIILKDMQDGTMRERSDDQLSGGQMMSAVVALRLALLQTIGARVAFFDEPTSNLDAARRENLAHAFRAIDVGREEVTEHWYDQLFLVSHDVAFSEITDKIIEL